MSDFDQLIYERALDAILGALYPKHIMNRDDAEQAAQDVMDDLTSSQLTVAETWSLRSAILPQFGETTPGDQTVSLRDGSTPIAAAAAAAVGLGRLDPPGARPVGIAKLSDAPDDTQKLVKVEQR